MKLDVIKSDDDGATWYADGLNFTCTQCGNCCTGPPGFVWISDEEIERLAGYLKLTVEQVQQQYCRRVAGRISLKERRTPQGLYDCIFLKEIGAKPGSPGSRRKACSIYAFRPLQCRTWPFWGQNLASRENWNHAAQRCHGMSHGPRHFSREEIESLRDAEDWPEKPPSSS